jgi:pimeloyl-ACP methyl ester carboxylesterase
LRDAPSPARHTSPGGAPAELHSVILHGRRVAYLRRGDFASGVAPIVLLHGLASNSSTWHPLLELLPDHITAIAPDLPGHGQSDGGAQDYTLAGHANIVRDLLAALGVPRATLVGHSYGGGVALQLAYQHPDLCERLVLVSSGGLGPDVSWILRLASLPGAEVVLPLIAPGVVRDAGNSFWAAVHKVGFRAPGLEQSWRAYSTLADPDTRASFLRTLRGVIGPTGQVLSARDRLYLAAGLPALIVWGARDRMIPVDHGQAAHESLPNSELVILQDSAHFPHHEQPNAFVAALTDFLHRTSPRAALA